MSLSSDLVTTPFWPSWLRTMLVSSKLMRNGTALERLRLLSKCRCHCQEVRTSDDQGVIQTVNLGSLFGGCFWVLISGISYAIVLKLGPKAAPKIGPKSNGKSAFAGRVFENLVRDFCTAVRLVGDDGFASGRPLIHESLHPFLSTVITFVPFFRRIFFCSQASVFFKDRIE